MLMLIAYHGIAFAMICQGTYVIQEACVLQKAGQPVSGGSPECDQDDKSALLWGYSLASYGYLALLLGLVSFWDGDFSIVLSPVMKVGLGGMAAYAFFILFGRRSRLG